MHQPGPPEGPSWTAYLEHFHAERPGITERILTRCRADGRDPYQWCAAALGDVAGTVLDLACGSGPMHQGRPNWVGVDSSTAELQAARGAGRGPLVRGSALALPVRAASCDAVVCSMGLQIVQPLKDALAEIALALRASRPVVLLLPAGWPVTPRDLLIYTRLQVAVRQRIHYPNDRALRRSALTSLAERVGLTVRSDEHRRFTLPIRTDGDAEELLSSLYLPNVGPDRTAAARRVLHAAVGHDLSVPLRRVTLERTGAPT